MIKLNLLPGYVLERGRIKMSLLVFFILVGLECGVLYLALQGYKAQEAWFKHDAEYFAAMKTAAETAKTDAGKLAGPSKAYDTWVGFFDRKSVVDYNEKLAAAMAEVPTKIGGSSAWFDHMVVEKTNVTLTGKIKGLMTFVEFYFKMKDAGFKVKPAAMPYPMNAKTQEIPLEVSGAITAAIPDPPKPPKECATWDKFYQKYTESAAPAGGAAPADGAAPTGSAAPTPAPAPPTAPPPPPR